MSSPKIQFSLALVRSNSSAHLPIWLRINNPQVTHKFKNGIIYLRHPWGYNVRGQNRNKNIGKIEKKQ